jgi:hypothetical protein
MFKTTSRLLLSPPILPDGDVAVEPPSREQADFRKPPKGRKLVWLIAPDRLEARLAGAPDTYRRGSPTMRG